MTKRIAVIGSGISGLASAYLLSQKYEVTLFEKASKLGGHTATIGVDYAGEQHAIDTGFIVFNDRTYPNFNRLLAQLDVESLPTEMSFSVFNPLNGLEYNGHSFASLFAQKRNILNVKFWRLLKDILRFNKLCKQLHERGDIDPALTLVDFLNKHGFNDYFRTHYILPMGAAIWSTSLAGMNEFQLKFFIRFFINHGLLDIANRPQWYVIKGGSCQYIPSLIKPFENNIVLDANIVKVERSAEQAILHFSEGEQQVFDAVVFACHSDQALNLLSDPSSKEQEILSAMPYQNNDVVLHTDEKMLPTKRAAWASWNYLLSNDDEQPASVTYNMNILQRLSTNTTFCVTLNQTAHIDESKIIQKFVYAHPVFNKTSLAAQQRKSEICGQNNTYFAGAYWYNGFHEDGVRSAVDVANKLGCEL
ncbi:NAD(P)/FAD-dependent oxidoreductase [Thalassotalea agarivorans]|uniref:Amine oxidase domain-containing protein n=1 Tax=Thalassotalea agarivorans TaxID=349064 RepID=A0A1H9Y556_THASX|nr:FAD-dependent oxidoreductase [Thalassotalea agarivorans]SES63833.1 hypothetical protein SAMN05660429_00073 [Thalassotalea agarivorans]